MTETEIKRIGRLLSDHSSFLITTHKNCDGDGLGAGMALYHGLRQIGKEALFRVLETPHPRYAFLDRGGEVIQAYDSSRPLPLKSGKALVLALDVNDRRILEPLYGDIKAGGFRVAFIDHHPLREAAVSPAGSAAAAGHAGSAGVASSAPNNSSSQAAGAVSPAGPAGPAEGSPPREEAAAGAEDYFFVDPSASSTAETVYEILKEMSVSMNEAIATALWTSIVFDTKFFRNIKKNSPKPFAVSAELIPYIPKPNLIYEHLFKRLKKESLSLFSRLGKAEFYRGDSLAVLRLEREDFEKHGAEKRQAYDLLDILMNIASVEAAVLILDGEEGAFKLSFRSREKSVLKAAESFGGGGHHQAAGAYVGGRSAAAGFQEVKRKAVDVLLKALAAPGSGAGEKG